MAGQPVLFLKRHQGGLTDSFGTYYLFICSLYNGSVSNSDYAAFSDWMIVNNELERMWNKMLMV
jgi:hypothetical protein